MFNKPLIENSLQAIFYVESWQKMIVELDEKSEELLAGGTRETGGNITLTAPSTISAGNSDSANFYEILTASPFFTDVP